MCLGTGRDVTEASRAPLTLSQKWTRTLQAIRHPVRLGVCWLALCSTRNPWTTIAGITVLSLSLALLGLFTNFVFESDDAVLFTPMGSLPPYHLDWINTQSDFPPVPRDLNVVLHSKGINIMEDCRGIMTKAFDVREALEGSEGYSTVCTTAEAEPCRWSSITQFFNNSRAVFEAANFQSNDDCLAALSTPFFPNGEFVVPTRILGYPTYDQDTSILISAESTLLQVALPTDEAIRDAVVDYETEVVDVLFEVEDQWKKENSSMVTVLEQFNESSFPNEFGRGFLENLPFVAVAFALMSVFVGAVFFKPDVVESRVSVGIGATAVVTLGMVAGFGLLFICGVPMTTIHGMLPFILVGIGLDDAFVIVGEFYRLPRSLPIEERMYNTMHEIGLSIATTTLTSAVAFALGCTSSIPVVYWMSLYSFPTITIIFLYTVTIFVAIIVIDERRVEARRRDLLCCVSAKKSEKELTKKYEEDESDIAEGAVPTSVSIVDQLLARYAEFLMKPIVKVVVLVLFSTLFAVCAWSTTLLKQEFSVGLVLPKGSYVVSFLDSMEIYTEFGTYEGTLYFRDMDQSTVEGQQAMETYLNEMVALKEISNQPDYFWLRDFQSFSRNNSAIDGLSFEEQVAVFLEQPVYQALYQNDIARDVQGRITASRVAVVYDQVDADDVTGQVAALDNQERVAREQPVNTGVAGIDWAFFSYDEDYFLWEFFKACPEELALTTITGVIAVTLITILAVPHWSAVLFSAPLVIVLYVDLLGFIQFAGVTINSVSYITLTLSIGLMVDFLIHILLSYFESGKTSRVEKVKDTLRTMGASVFMGGLTTFLGVLPLAFSKTGLFEVVFFTFIGLVLLGVTHGLIVLPVLLSIFGPEESIQGLLGEDNAAQNDAAAAESEGEAGVSSNVVSHEGAKDGDIEGADVAVQ
jgi:Niemann-Pick C1 protein